MKLKSIPSFFALIVVATDAAVRGTTSSSNRRLRHNENGASASSRYQGLANTIDIYYCYNRNMPFIRKWLKKKEVGNLSFSDAYFNLIAL
jgi:hypothetical protein